MNRAVSAIAGGVAATAVFSLLLLLLEAQTRSAVFIFDAVARFVGVPGSPAVGFVLFALAGAVAWPLLFVALEEYIPRGPDPAARGVVFASVLWVAFVGANRSDVSGPVLLIYLPFTLFAHWAYGFTLGAVYGRLLDS